MQKTRTTLATLSCVCALSCVHAATTLEWTRADDQNRALTEAGERFYRAKDVATLKQAAAEAATIAKDSALAHELAARIADLEERPRDEARELAAAIADVNDPLAALHLQWLRAVVTPVEDLPSRQALYSAIASAHPRADVRARAAFAEMEIAHRRGDLAARNAARASVSGILPLWVIGSWDNDQGRALRQTLPPEQQIDLSQSYPGALIPISWRKIPSDWSGYVNFTSHLAPHEWSLAYAAAGVRVATAGEYELRLGTDDPFEVFINDTPVFTLESTAHGFADGWTLPITLRAGNNRILVKTAHRSGSWVLLARLTGPGGKAVPWETISPQEPPASGATSPSLKPADVISQDSELALLGPARKAAIAAWLAHRLAGEEVATPLADAYGKEAPGALLAEYELAMAAWHGERGRVTDLVAHLASVGSAFVTLPTSQANLWLEQGLKDQARAPLLALVKTHPKTHYLQRTLAALYAAEGWTEDRCEAWGTLFRAGLADIQDVLALAECQEALGRSPEGLKQLDGLLSSVPYDSAVLERKSHWLMSWGRLREAETTTQTWTQENPDSLAAWERLAEILRRERRWKDSSAALDKAAELSPDAWGVYDAKAHLAYETGEISSATALWKKALTLNPKSEAISRRVAALSPASPEPWLTDVPSDKDLAQIVKRRGALGPLSTAQTAYLDDDAVFNVHPDGSASAVFTQVAQILGPRGRDRFTHMDLRNHGQVHILHAYSINAVGERVDASSTEGNVVRFRALETGATVVIQYRSEMGPNAILAKDWRMGWHFQESETQMVLSRMTVWLPNGTPLHVEGTSAAERTDETRGQQQRITWTMRDVPPLPHEINMPSLWESGQELRVSAVTDWDAFTRYLAALWQGVFRTTPEVDALAEKLFKGAPSKEEKLFRIQEYIETNFRYEKDYPTVISNWRPSPAPVVLERRYGDCKDRVTLFVTLAEKAGVHAEAALLVTRNAGPRVSDKFPEPAFNHAIVYIPAQDGFPKARFFDSTVEDLDLTTLRSDDPGGLAYVYDPIQQRAHFESIPFQEPTAHGSQWRGHLHMDETGTLAGRLEFQAQGDLARLLRYLARNPELLDKGVQGIVGRLLPGATADDIKLLESQSLRKPVSMTTAIRSDTTVRREGDGLRMKIPFMLAEAQSFTLAERQYPLLLGPPRSEDWRWDVTLPARVRAVHLPQSVKVDAPCFSFSRKTESHTGTVTSDISFTSRCERITPDAYAEHRKQIQRIQQLLEEDVVFSSPPAQAPAKKPTPAPAIAKDTP